MIIGGHGSAFVNTIYAKNAAVIELVDKSYDPIHDYLIANANSVDLLKKIK